MATKQKMKSSRSAVTRRTPGAQGAAKGPQAHDAAERGPGVAPEARHRLAECCAFFIAERYREAAPGHIRQRDIEAAEAEIAEILRHCGKP